MSRLVTFAKDGKRWSRSSEAIRDTDVRGSSQVSVLPEESL